MRISERLWAAIDNIGSQSYSGSWNREFVARWLRIFKEHLSGHGSNPLVQWTFSPAAGVWTRFDEIMRSRPEWVHCRDRFWSVILPNFVPSAAPARSFFSGERLSPELGALDGGLVIPALNANPLLNALREGIDSSTSFSADFEHDYSMSFKRYYYLLRRGGEPAFLLTFSNYPDWASFNKAHDWHYLFPVGEQAALSSEEETELLACLREVIHSAGCTPFRMCIVSESMRLSIGNEWTNFLLKPEALEYAAVSLEGA